MLPIQFSLKYFKIELYFPECILTTLKPVVHWNTLSCWTWLFKKLTFICQIMFSIILKPILITNNTDTNFFKVALGQHRVAITTFTPPPPLPPNNFTVTLIFWNLFLVDTTQIRQPILPPPKLKSKNFFIFSIFQAHTAK